MTEKLHWIEISIIHAYNDNCLQSFESNYTEGKTCLNESRSRFKVKHSFYTHSRFQLD